MEMAIPALLVAPRGHVRLLSGHFQEALAAQQQVVAVMMPVVVAAALHLQALPVGQALVAPETQVAPAASDKEMVAPVVVEQMDRVPWAIYQAVAAAVVAAVVELPAPAPMAR